MIVKLRYLTFFLDYLVLMVAFTAAYFARVGFLFSTDFPFLPYFYTALLASGVWISSLMVFKGYTPTVRFTRVIHHVKIMVAGFTGTAAFGILFYFTQKTLFSRLLLLFIFLFGCTLLSSFHLALRQLEIFLIKKGYGNIRLLIIGSNRGVKSFIESLKQSPSPYIPVAILDGYGTSQKEIVGVPVLGKLNILEEAIDRYHIDAIVQGDNIEQVINIVHFCEQHELDYYLLPYLLGMVQDHLTIRTLEKPLITRKRTGPISSLEKLLG